MPKKRNDDDDDSSEEEEENIVFNDVEYNNFIDNIKLGFYNSIHRFTKFKKSNSQGKECVKFSKYYTELFIGNLLSHHKVIHVNKKSTILLLAIIYL